MIRRAACLILLAGALSACDERDPVADGANNLAGTAEIETLPPDESTAVNTGEPAAATVGSVIPAALHGRWGLTPADCTSTRGDAKGLLVVSASELRFYESVARPLPGAETSAESMTGDFAFTGEGQSWTRHQALARRGEELTRTETGPAASFTYVRCR